MRHNRDEKRFDRTYSHLKSMMSNMTNDLITVGRIKTTTQRAKVLRSWAEKMITLGKNGTTAARRRAMAFLKSKSSVTRLFADLAPQYKERNGGYTRILKLGNRPGDNASMSIIELVEGAGVAAAEAAPKAAKTKKAPAKAKAAPKAKAEKTEKAEKAPKKTAPKKAKAETTTEKTAEKKAPAKRVKKETKPKE